MNKKLSIVVVAGGKGSRMGKDVPKQYIELKGIPIFIHTLLNLNRLSPESELILVVPLGDIDYVRLLLQRYNLQDVCVTYGGKSRAESVFNGLQQARCDYVAIHDAVRPFVTSRMFDDLVNAMADSDAVIPAILPIDSVRISLDGGTPYSVDRNKVYLVQTPQCFKRSILSVAYDSFFSSPSDALTDDSSIVEHYASISPVLVSGDINNIKITTPKDLLLADFILDEHSY